MADWKGKRTFVPPSSSSEEDDYGYVEEEYGYGYVEEEYDDGDEDEDEDDGESISNSSENRSYSRYGEEEESDDDDDGSNNGDQDGDGDGDGDHDQEYLCSTVIRFLHEGNDLRALNLKECKAYLRMNGLRITGTKADCIQRIKEDWRMKRRKENRNIKKAQMRCDHSSGTIQSCWTKGESYNGEIMKTETRYLQSSETCQTCGTTGFKVEERYLHSTATL